MSLPDLQGTFFPEFSREYQAEVLETGKFTLYQGETFNGNLYIRNSGSENAEAFDVDLYISTDGIIDTSDRYLRTYTVVEGIEGRSSYPGWGNWNPTETNIVTRLPDPNDGFWKDDLDTYYLGAIIDPDNAIAESNEDNNTSEATASQGFLSVGGFASSPISVEKADLPVVTFNQNGSQLQINLSEAASADGFIIDYINLTREDYINSVNISTHSYWQHGYGYGYVGNFFYDPEFDRLYVTKESYYDLKDYQYYDADGGHYDPTEDKYFNADGSYYDVAEQLFYDADGHAIELTDNSVEHNESDSTPRHYLPTGGYISLTSGNFYDAYGGYIDEIQAEYLFGEDETGFGSNSEELKFLKSEHGALELGTGILPKVATPNLDYEIILGENIAEITDSTIIIVPGSTSATIDFNFLTDSIFDPSETIELALLENDEKYVVGRSYLYRYFEPKIYLEDLQKPSQGNYNFSVYKNADPGTVIGQIEFSDPQGDELNYSLIKGQSDTDTDTDFIESIGYYEYPKYTDINLAPELIETSNQDLDGDGIHPFSIDSVTGTITLSDFDDLDREEANNLNSDRQQLYNDGYYQLFLRVADTIPTAEDLQYSAVDLYDTILVNVKVTDFPTTPYSDRISGSLDSDLIEGGSGVDTLEGMAGDDTLRGGANPDFLLGNVGNDQLYGDEADDFLNGGTGNDLLSGDADHDFLIGMAGDDTLEGNDGQDFLFGMMDNDLLNGGNGEDLLNGGTGDDTLNGGGNNDVLVGQIGNDLLNGNEGDDNLYGGVGIDTLAGNTGADIFVLGIDSGTDLIVDFEDGFDMIGLPTNKSLAELNITYDAETGLTSIFDRNTDEMLFNLENIEANLITEADFTSL